MQVLHTNLSKRKEVQEFAKRMFGITLHFDAVSKKVGFRVGDPGVAVLNRTGMSGHFVSELPTGRRGWCSR